MCSIAPNTFGHRFAPPSHMPRNHRLPSVYRQIAGAERETAPNDPLARDATLALLEAVLLIADEPLPIRKLVQATGLPDASVVRQALKTLQHLYDSGESAFELEELAGGFQLMTRPEYHRWLTSLRKSQQDLKLTPASRETLAIIAYRQPATRGEIEAIRGVAVSTNILKALEDRGWIEVIGHKDTPGRPALYATTKSFLNDLSLRSLSELPPLAELDAHPALELPEVPQEPVYPEQGRIDDVNESDDLLAPAAPDTPPALPESADAALFEISDGDAMTQPASPTVH